MKKRILALALAATTAFSMLGSGLSVSAAGIDPWNTGDIKNYAPEKLWIEYTKAVEDESDASARFYYGESATDATEIDVADFSTAITYDDAVASDLANDVPYLYNYIDDDKVDLAKAVEAVEAGNAVALAELIDKSRDSIDLTTGDKTEIPLKKSKGTYRSFRAELENKFDSFRKSMLDPEMNGVKGNAYNFDDLINEIKNATVSELASSQLVAYIQLYNTYMEYADLPDLDAQIEKVQAQIDALSMRGEDEFKVAKDYQYFLADLDELQAKLDDAKTYSDVTKIEADVKKLSIKYTSAGADKAELKDLLLSLFDDVTISRIPSAYPVKGQGGAVYNSKDYGAKTDAWKEFAAAYEKAFDLYKRVSSKSFQTDVNNMVEELMSAIDGLSATNVAPNWLIVRLEETLAKAYALDSADYTKASWKVIEAAIAKAEAVLESENPGYTAANNAVAALETALKETPAKPTTSEKNALKSAITEAEKVLKGLDKEDNGAQYYALTAAINEAKALFVGNNPNNTKGLKGTTKKSDIANAIDALNAAIDFSEVVMGWNKLANGTWMYGTEDGYVTSAWKWIGSAWYYFDANGIMVTGWQQLDGAWYYFYNWGGMAKGWALVNGTWYYLNPNGGKMLANGWNWIDGKCYYFYSWGGMAANTTIDGYKVDASGAWVK